MKEPKTNKTKKFPGIALLQFIGEIVVGIEEKSLINVTTPTQEAVDLIKAVLTALNMEEIQVLGGDTPFNGSLLPPIIWLSKEPVPSMGIQETYGPPRLVHLDDQLARFLPIDQETIQAHVDYFASLTGIVPGDLRHALPDSGSSYKNPGFTL